MTTAASGTTTCVLIEDEPLARRRLRELVRGVAWLDCIGEAANGRSAIRTIDELQPDLVFLDIQLPGASGLDVLSGIRHTPAVIFTTAFDKFAVTAFELGALDYLLKPFGADRFAQALARAKPRLTDEPDAAAARARCVLPSESLSRLFVRDGQRILPIRVAAIEHFEAHDDFVIVHAAGRVFRVNVTLNDLARRLDPLVFLRVHRSHVVNLDHVAAWTPEDGSRFRITLRSGATLMASRQRSRALREIGP